MSNVKILRVVDICKKLNLCRTAVNKLIATDDFPRKIQLTTKSIGFLESEINAWILSKQEQRDTDQVKEV